MDKAIQSRPCICHDGAAQSKMRQLLKCKRAATLASSTVRTLFFTDEYQGTSRPPGPRVKAARFFKRLTCNREKTITPLCCGVRHELYQQRPANNGMVCCYGSGGTKSVGHSIF